MIRKSKKQSLIHVLKKVSDDVRSVTGSNLQKIVLISSKAVFRKIPDGEERRIDIVKEIIDIENERLKLGGFTAKELQKF